MAQYGRTLTLVAQYYRLSGGDPTGLLLKHSLKITDISGEEVPCLFGHPYSLR